MVKTLRIRGAMAALSLLVLGVPAWGQKVAPGKAASTPPATAGPIGASTSTKSPPPGAVPAQIQDLRVIAGKKEADPWELERLGVGAAQANQLDRARDFFEKSWKAGELPTAPFNLACIDARQHKTDAALRQLDRAIAAGLDDESLLQSDPDLAPLRGGPAFARVVEGARRNRLAGDAAVVREGVFIPPSTPTRGILVLLHEAPSDPLTVANAFLGEARARSLYVAAPRGPSRAGRKRFGWGEVTRAISAVNAAVIEARKKAGALPVVLVGVGRGGTIAWAAAARIQGAVAVASISGPPDSGQTEKAQELAALRGRRLVLGVAADAPPSLREAMKRASAAVKGAGLAVTELHWPGTGIGLPADTPRAVRETLDAAGAVRTAPKRR